MTTSANADADDLDVCEHGVMGGCEIRCVSCGHSCAHHFWDPNNLPAFRCLGECAHVDCSLTGGGCDGFQRCDG